MYFQNFNAIYYTFDIAGRQELRVVTDITTNVRIRKAILENITLYDTYDIQNNDTPDIVAHKVYGSTQYHWVIMLCNQIFDYVEDWPMPSRQLEDYIADKYPATSGATHHHVNSNGYVVMPLQSGDDAAEHVPVTNYAHEVAINDAKRRIKLINPQLLSKILKQFDDII